MGIEFFNFRHVRVNIAGGCDHGSDPADFALIIQISQHNGDPRAVGDEVKTGFPARDLGAGTGRRNDHSQLLTVLKSLNRLSHDIV